ncbi:hypothetical protein [Bradyrhizobium sp. LA6.7]
MPQVSAIFSSQIYRGSNLPAEGKAVLIEDWHEEQLWGRDCYLLDLVDDPLVLQLTSTLARDIEQILGTGEIEDWAERWITIYPVTKTMPDRDTGKEKTICMIRARACDKDQGPRRRPRKDMPDDGVPF